MEKKSRKNYRINMTPIFIMLAGLAAFSVILFVTLKETAKDIKSPGKLLSSGEANNSALAPETSEQPAYDGEMVAVLKELDAENKRLTLLDTENKETRVLFYTGGSDVTDKYGQIISIQQIPAGTMVDVYYNKDDNKLSKLQISTKAWEYIGVNNLEINPSDRIMKIGGTKYKFTDEIVILNDGAAAGISDLAEPDELNVWGYDQSIWSITVTRGHGTVKLTDAEAFLGGSITVGYEAMQQVTEDLVLKVREGNFNLTVENGQYSGTKNITVYRNQETEVSLRDLGPEVVKRGKVTFEIYPFGADLFVDGELVSYANPIELAYGKHDLKVSLGGYATYIGSLNLDVAGKKIKISLPEEQSSEEAQVEEIGDSSTEAGDNTGTSGNTTPVTDYNQWNNPGEETETPEAPKDDSTEEDKTEEDKTEDDKTEDEYILDEEHMIYVQYPTGASVYLNGDYMGVSPGSFKKAIGSQVLTFIREGYETKSYTIDVLDDGLDMYLSLPDLVKINN